MKQFIDDPSKWPNWPFLAVKRNGSTMNVGVLIDENDTNRTIYHVNFFDLPKNGLKDKPKTIYPNTDAMLADGWVID